MEQELFLAESPWGPEALSGKYLILLPTLLLTGHMPLATSPVQSSPRKDLHGTGGAGEHMEQAERGGMLWEPGGGMKHHEL